MRIYTRAFTPFRMGGPVQHHIAAEVSSTDAIDLGKAKVCVVVSPKTGKTYVVEAETGAIVGNNIDEVRQDLTMADPDVLAKQIVQARKDSKQADLLSAEEFWDRMSRARN